MIASSIASETLIKKERKLERIIQASFEGESQHVSQTIIDLLLQCNISLPSLRHGGLKRLGEVLNSETPIIIASVQCPDYSYIKTTEESAKSYEFTFETLGNDVGLIAQQILTIAPLFHNFFSDLSIQHKFSFAIADYEGLNPSTLKKVNLSKHEFQHRCRQSLQKFTDCLELFPDTYSASLITELESVVWDDLVYHEASRIIKETKGSSRRSISSIYQTAANASKALYTKWFELDENSDSYYERLLDLTKADAINYLSIALAFSKAHQNSPMIILSCDRPSMAFFYELMGEVHSHPTCVLHLNKSMY
ncbi:MAG: hypothetical protein AAGD25_12495 [Cyanobacteria bacterium P01_F01_bin.150]